jgi:hypothetical protein
MSDTTYFREDRRTPHLCVVGHPNKGKSSIVSTLTENDSVQIGAESGTTVRANTFDFVLGGKILLSLTDTPGFQRARQVLAWLEQEPVAPAERPARVEAFLAQPEHTQRFPDEVALLTPIMDGAGILYVVDGAQPVSPADEAEMEILRWTGQPRMAVINPMGATNRQDEWQRALSQFFQWVRVFNPLTATLPARETLLRAVGELAPGWSQPVTELCQRLHAREQQRLSDVSQALAEYWGNQLTQRVPLSLLDKTANKGLRGNLSEHKLAEEKLRRLLDAEEAQFFDQLRHAWGFQATSLDQASGEQSPWQLEGDKLMNTETWYLWGLKQHELLMVTGGAGAATGLLVDAGLGGTSLFLGAVSGGLIGSAGGWWASQQMTGKRLGWLPLTRQKQYVGPVQHPNFPLVVMARALTFTQQLWLRPHAERSRLALRTDAHTWSHKEQVQLVQWSKLIQKGQWKPQHQEALCQWIEQTLQSRLQQAMRGEQASAWQSL